MDRDLLLRKALGALILSIKEGHLAVVEYLISQGVTINPKYDFYRSAYFQFRFKQPQSRKLWLHQNSGEHWSPLMVALNSCKRNAESQKAIVKFLLSNGAALEYRIVVEFNYPDKRKSIRMNVILGAQMHGSLSLLVKCIKETEGDRYEASIKLFNQYPLLFKDVCSDGLKNDMDRLVFAVQTALIQYLLQTTSNALESQDVDTRKFKKNPIARAWQGTDKGVFHTSQAGQYYKLFTDLCINTNLPTYLVISAKKQDDIKAAVNRISKRIKGPAKLTPFNAILFDVISMNPACAELCGIKPAEVNTPPKHSSRFIGGTVVTSSGNEGDDNNNNNEEEDSSATLTHPMAIGIF